MIYKIVYLDYDIYVREIHLHIWCISILLDLLLTIFLGNVNVYIVNDR